MSILDQVKKRLEYEDKKERFLLRPFHSGFYHRQFEGYTEYRRKDEKGKYKVTRVYTGQYYEAAVTERQILLRKAGYCFLYFLALVFFLRGTVTDIPINRDNAVNIITAVTVPVVFWMGLGLGNYVLSPRRMTIPVYKSGAVRLKKAALAVTLLSGMRLIVLLFYCLGIQSGFYAGDVQAVLSAVLSGGCALLVNRLEAGIRYSSIENTITPEPDGIEIR